MKRHASKITGRNTGGRDRLLFSLSHRMGESWGEGVLVRLWPLSQICNLQFSIPNFQFPPIGGEGLGEGPLRFMVPTRVKSLRFSLSAHLPRRLIRSFCLLLAGALLACVGSVGELSGAELPAGAGPLFHEATNEFGTMKTTVYQHQTRVDRATGSYRYDCVGFVSYALKQATPQAWATIVKATGLAKGRIPSPPRYRAFFASLAEKPQAGWEAVTKASELRPGDVVAWEHKTERSSGHAVIIGGPPVPGPDGSWLVQVYDSTSSPHGEDSRPKDQRAEVLAATGRRSGLGHGVLVLLTDPAGGALTGLRWGPKAKPITVPIAAGRPSS